MANRRWTIKNKIATRTRIKGGCVVQSVNISKEQKRQAGVADIGAGPKLFNSEVLNKCLYLSVARRRSGGV